MTEPGRTRPTTNTYWVAHGTTPLRVSSKHLGPDLSHTDETDPTQRAKQALDQTRGKSATLYTDLTNKRRCAEVVTEDEDDVTEPPAANPAEPQDH